MRKIIGLGIGMVLFALVISACTTPPFETGSKLICPKDYVPGSSVCKAKQTAGETVDATKEQEMDPVRLEVGQIGIYLLNPEKYAIYEGVGYHPTPTGYVRVYSKTQMSVVSDIDPQACGGAYNDSNCIKSLENVTLKGYQKFGASYVMDISFDFSTQENLRLMYEVGGPNPLMAKFNDRSRDTLRDSGDIDPEKYISGEIKKPDVATNWLNKLKTSKYMMSWQYFKLFTFDDLAVRYFEPEKSASGDSTSSSQVLEDQAFNDYLKKKDLFCKQYAAGSSLSAECDRTFVCSQTEKTCNFGAAIIPIDQLPTVTAEPDSIEKP